MMKLLSLFWGTFTSSSQETYQAYSTAPRAPMEHTSEVTYLHWDSQQSFSMNTYVHISYTRLLDAAACNDC